MYSQITSSQLAYQAYPQLTQQHRFQPESSNFSQQTSHNLPAGATSNRFIYTNQNLSYSTALLNTEEIEGPPGVNRAENAFNIGM
jgi:hypothetical protein